MSKMNVRQIEENLPTISMSMAKMRPVERLSICIIYQQVKKVFLTLKQRSYILDVGCGDGLWLNEISNEMNRSVKQYVGVDMSINKLRFAKDKFKELGVYRNVCFVLADAEHLPFKESTFDVIVMIEVLEHFFNPAANISELSKTIKQYGKVLVTTPSAYGANANILSIFKLLFCPVKKKPTSRKSSLMIQGMKLPHRDFTLPELLDLISPSFTLKKYHSFNFGIQYLFKRLLPDHSVIFLTELLESKAYVFPYTWGHNWMLLLENCK